MAKCGRYSNPAFHARRSRPEPRSRVGLLFAAVLVMIMEGSYAGPRPSGSLVPTRSEVIATHGMAATSHPLVSQVALDVLKRGGTAVDAAIAANAALGLMEPTGNGVGGDLFAIVWDAKTKKLHGLNASGRSPKSLTLAKLREELRKLNRSTIPPRGPAAGVGARHGRRLVRAARQVRQAADEGTAAARHPLRARRLSGHRGDRGRLGGQREAR